MDKMKMESANLTDRNIEKIAALFPNCITETADENGRLKKAVNFEIPKDLKVIADKRIADEDVSWSPLRNWGSESKRSDAKNCFYPIIVQNDEIVGFGDVSPDDYHPQQTVLEGDQYYVYPIDIQGIERKWRYAGRLLYPRRNNADYARRL